MDSDNRAHNHWLLIAQAQEIGVLQVVSSPWWRCLQLEWQAIQSTFSDPRNLLSLLLPTPPPEIFEFSFNPLWQIGSPPGNLDRLFQFHIKSQLIVSVDRKIKSFLSCLVLSDKIRL